MDRLFAPFLGEAGFRQASPPQVSGRIYRADYDGAGRQVSISYEPGEDYFAVYVFERTRSGLSEIDDASRTLTLAALNKRYASGAAREERQANELYFSAFEPRSALERRVLKAAKDLRIALQGLERATREP